MQGDVVEIVAKALHQHEWGDRFQWAKDNEAGHQYWRDTATAMIAALAQNGWAVVPVEPTKKMHKAAWDACENDMKPGRDWPAFNAKIYRAMLSAAPSGARPRT